MRATLFILAMVAILSFAAVACHDNDSSNNSRNTFTEDQFVEDPNLKANPETDLIVKFLEPPPTKVILANTRDTGDVGFDEIVFSYSRTQDHTICIDNDPIAAHTYQLEGEGIEPIIFTEGECTNTVIPQGDYTLRSIHDGLSEKTHTVFVIPNPDKIIEASNKDGLIDKVRSFAINAINLITNKTVENAHAQTSTLETLISTRACTACDLRGTDLSFRDLQGVDLTGANLRNANLQGANLKSAELTAVKFQGADLSDAQCNRADFTVAKFDTTTTHTGTNVSGATWTDGSCKCAENTIYTTSFFNNNVSQTDSVSLTDAGLPFATGTDPRGIAVSPDGEFLYTINSVDSSVSIIEVSTGNTTIVPTGTSPIGIDITTDGSKLYVANASDSNITEIDLATNMTSNINTFEPGANDVAVSPDGSRVYAATVGIFVLDTASKTVVGVVDLPGENSPSAVAVSPDGSQVYAVKPVDNTLHIIDAQSSQLTGTFTVPNATDLAVLPDGSKLYISGNDGKLTIFDLASNTASTPITLSGSGDSSVTISPSGLTAYVANFQTNVVSVVDTTTETLTTNVNINLQPTAVALSPDLSIGICTGCQ